MFEPSFILREWNAFWIGFERVRASVDRELRTAFEKRRACRVAGELKRVLGDAPVEASLEPLIESILRIAERPRIAAGAARALKAAMTPWTPPITSRASAQTRAAHRPTRSRGRYERCAKALHEWSLRDWSEENATLVFRAVEDDPFDLELLAMLERPHRARWLRAVLQARTHIDPGKRNLVMLQKLANAGASASEMVALYDDAAQLPFEAIHAALRLTRDMATLREILPRLANRPYSDLDALAELPAQPEGFRPAHLKAWIVLARRAVGLDPATVQRLRPAPFGGDAPWIARYPAELHDALARFASIEPDAESRAAAILAPDIRSEECIRRELERLPPSASERRAALIDRLAHPRRPSARRLARLARRLEVAADRTGVERWTAAIEAHLCAHSDMDLDPEMLAALRTLQRPMRRLAERVLREGDLRDDPRNAAFLKRMAQLGVNMTPWLDGIGVYSSRGYSLALEDDPIEVLKMGGYFSTCLSPGAFNFYAAVVDAADVNKRVLYARDAQGVVARVLLALDAQGELVRYETFRHGNDGVEHAIEGFIRALVCRMGTRYAPRPDLIELLTADRWYCDCPLPAPAGDDLETLLGAAPEHAVIAHLESAIELSPHTLVALIERLARHPTKAEPVLRCLVERRDEVPAASLRTAAAIAEGLGLRTLAGDLVEHRAAELLWTRYRALDCFVAGVLLDRDPRTLLRRLRRRGGWARESRPTVLLFAGRALRRIEKPRKARDVLAIAAARGSKAAQRELMRAN